MGVLTHDSSKTGEANVTVFFKLLYKHTKHHKAAEHTGRRALTALSCVDEQTDTCDLAILILFCCIHDNWELGIFQLGNADTTLTVGKMDACLPATGLTSVKGCHIGINSDSSSSKRVK